MKVKTNLSVFVWALLLGACSDNDRLRITETGTLEATEITVSAQVSGTVRSVAVIEGATVQPGDTLALLDDTEWVFQLKQADANLAASDAQFRLAREGARREDIVQAEANYSSAKADLARMEELYAARSISEKQLEDARTRYTVAEQTYRKLKDGSRPDEIRLARARRDQAAAQVALFRKKVEDCTLRAPTGGTVVTRFVEPGELVAPGSAIVRIADLRTLTMKVYVGETIVPRIRLGQPASVFVDAFEDRPFPATVSYISPTAEFTPKNIQTKDERVKLVFAVKLRVDNPDGILKAGIPADAALELEGNAE